MEAISLKAARVNAGYSQVEAARLLNTSKSTISRCEKGFVKITEQRLQQMCQLYGIEPEFIERR